MKRKKTLMVIVSAVTACGAVVLLAGWLRLTPAPVEVVIPPGASAKEIASILHGAGLISMRAVFVPVVRLTGKAHELKAGTFLIPGRSSIFKVIRILTEGKAQYVKVTIPEGFNSRQVAEVLASHNVVQRDRFLQLVQQQKLEGYLFPDTYFFEANTPEEKVIERLTAQFNRHFTPAMDERCRELGFTRHQAVTLASIIEREAARAEERPLISGVFHNRLKKHWYLESCATVEYALGEHKAKLTLKDLRLKSPYNTYRTFGLPPGPICNPGAPSLDAALNPAKTDAMFFVVKGGGSHSFSRYFNEHLKNKRQNRRR